MQDESDSDEVVDAGVQQVRWKIEAIVIRRMKAAGRMDEAQLVGAVLSDWGQLGRPETMSGDFVLERLRYLVRKEWFSRSEAGEYVLRDISEQQQ